MPLPRPPLWPPLLTLLLLGGLGVQTALRPRPADAEPYHALVRAAAAQMPLRFGEWIGREVPVPEGATALLHPNVIISRTYHNTTTGRGVGFLLVQCRDVRDMSGHYPPICYPGQGWVQTLCQNHQIRVENLPLPVDESVYTFQRVARGQSEEIIVHNFLVFPDGHIGSDMSAMRSLTKDLRRRFYGAGQVQLILEAGLPRAEQDQIVQDFLRQARPIIVQILAGGAP